MQFWHEQSHRYHTELQDFKKLTDEAVDGLRSECEKKTVKEILKEN